MLTDAGQTACSREFWGAMLWGREMRIGALSETNLGNGNYRQRLPLDTIARGRGYDVYGNAEGRPARLPVLQRCDVVHIHRIAFPELRQVVMRLRDQGIGLVWDNDDDVTAIPKTNPLYKRFGGAKSRELLADVKAMVQMADVVTTPSLELAEQYRALGADDVRVLENYLPSKLSSARRSRHDGVVVACLAGMEHQVDYQGLGLDSTLERLLERHPQLGVLGIGLGHGLISPRYEHIPIVDFMRLPTTLARADIGIAPLVDIPWNRARSNVKLKEYGAGGLAWLASPVRPYQSLGEAQGGRLVPDDRWEDAIERLILDARERRRLAKRARKWAETETIDRHAERWDAVLHDAAERGAARRSRVTPAPRPREADTPRKRR